MCGWKIIKPLFTDDIGGLLYIVYTKIRIKICQSNDLDQKLGTVQYPVVSIKVVDKWIFNLSTYATSIIGVHPDITQHMYIFTMNGSGVAKHHFG